MLVCPVIFLVASSVTVTMASQVKFVAEKLEQLRVPAAPILVLLDALPFLLIWTLFTFLYIFMPNTKVRFRSGLIAGVAAGTAYVAIQWIYVASRSGRRGTTRSTGASPRCPSSSSGCSLAG